MIRDDLSMVSPGSLHMLWLVSGAQTWGVFFLFGG